MFKLVRPEQQKVIVQMCTYGCMLQYEGPSNKLCKRTQMPPRKEQPSPYEGKKWLLPLCNYEYGVIDAVHVMFIIIIDKYLHMH